MTNNNNTPSISFAKIRNAIKYNIEEPYVCGICMTDKSFIDFDIGQSTSALNGKLSVCEDCLRIYGHRLTIMERFGHQDTCVACKKSYKILTALCQTRSQNKSLGMFFCSQCALKHEPKYLWGEYSISTKKRNTCKECDRGYIRDIRTPRVDPDICEDCYLRRETIDYLLIKESPNSNNSSNLLVLIYKNKIDSTYRFEVHRQLCESKVYATRLLKEQSGYASPFECSVAITKFKL